MYKLCFYVPESHLDVVKQAVFAAGGGRIGAYDSCCWQSLGQGQFRPLDGSQPYLARSARSSTWRSGKWSWWWPTSSSTPASRR